MKSRGGRSIGSSDDRGGRGWRSRDAVRKFTANRGRKLKRNGTPLPDYLNMYKSGQLSSRPSFVHTSRKIVPSLSPSRFDKIFSREGRGHARKRFPKWVVINRKSGPGTESIESGGLGRRRWKVVRIGRTPGEL